MQVETVGFIVGLLGLALAIASFGYALYQGSERKKLERYVRSQNWHLYTKENNANGTLQVAISAYKKHHAQGMLPEVVEQLSKADAFSQDVFKDVVRQIQLSEKRFTFSAIDEWVKEGKVSEAHAKALFQPLVVDH